MKHSTLLIHQLSTGFWGKYSDLVDEVSNSTGLMQRIQTVYTENTTLTKTRIETLLSKEKNMDADTCLDSGFVHEIW